MFGARWLTWNEMNTSSSDGLSPFSNDSGEAETVFNESQLTYNQTQLVRTSAVDSLISISTALILVTMILATAIGN